MNRKPVFILVVVTIIVMILSLKSYANAEPNESDWEFNLAPFYLWAVNIDGDLTIGPATAPVEVQFEDVFDSLEGAFIVHFESVYKARWGFLFDVNYLDLENNMSLPMGISQNVGLNLTLAEFSGFYRHHVDTHAVDFIAGVRYVDMDANITVVGGPTLLDTNRDWLDPLIGARWVWQFTEGWSLVARGDIGGFGVGSDFSWQALGIVEWQPWKYASFIAGYRALNMDYEDGSGRDYFNFDATIHGPVIGLNFKW